ncbi:MAG: cell envelope integrity protein CreD [Clostridia bacterium]|nr:cell envelope integrity protein CreD [Clostridia bacterium]
MLRQVTAIVIIFIFSTVAWLALGSVIEVRTNRQDHMLRGEVGQLWGAQQRQHAPQIYSYTPGKVKRFLPLDASKIDVSLKIDYRQKGLLWYSTYIVNFDGRYKITNTSDQPLEINFDFFVPMQDTIYKDFKLFEGQREIQNIHLEEGIVNRVLRLNPGQSENIEVSYISQGIDEWSYDFGNNASQIRNFSMKMVTDFKDIDFPRNSISPTAKKAVSSGWELNWDYSSLLSNVRLGMVMPHKLNPGPWVARISFFAPISLFFFLFVLFILTTLKGIQIHPANYFFTCAAYFSFHLLLAYLADHLSIHLAFFICSFVSIFLVVSYMRLIVGKRFAFIEVGISQFIFLVVFSYTFFFEGYTGLAVVILCIITLFIVMQLTARINWSELSPKTKTHAS